MSILRKLGMGQGYVKAGFQGFAGSGKTYTATELAIGVRDFFKLEGPIAFFDTEGGAEYIAKKVRAATGMDLVGVRSRSLADLLATVRECEQAGVSVLIVDSITHVWKELQDSHLAGVNRARQAKGMKPRYSLEFQDWNPIKTKWEEWTSLFLNSRLHIIFCGRAGFSYDHATNEETGKKELVKTGTKMKAENEFGYEPSLLVEMEQVDVGLRGKGKKTKINRATILKDRFDVFCGMSIDAPKFKDFLPHVRELKAGAHAPVDTSIKTQALVDDDGRDENKRRRTVFLEEIEGELTTSFPATQGKDKVAKLTILNEVFGTRSWEAISSMHPDKLKGGLERIRNMLSEKRAESGELPEIQREPAPA